MPAPVLTQLAVHLPRLHTLLLHAAARHLFNRGSTPPPPRQTGSPSSHIDPNASQHVVACRVIFDDGYRIAVQDFVQGIRKAVGEVEAEAE